MISDKLFLTYVIGFGKTFIDITKMVVDDGVDVVLVPVMELRSSFLDSLGRVEDGGKLFVVHLDQIQGFFGCLFIHGDHCSHLISDIAHAFFGQDMLVIPGRSDSVGDVGNIFSGQNQLDSWKPFSACRVDPVDSTVGDGRMKDFSVKHILKIVIARILGSAGDFIDRIHSRQAFSDCLVLSQIICSSRQLFCVLIFFPVLDRFHDTGVSRAAAEISRESFFDFCVGRIRIVLNERISTEEYPGYAKTTLDSTVVDEGSLERMKLSSARDSFNRRDLFPFTGNRQEETTVLGLSVDEHSTGPAHTAIAAFLGSREPELIPKRIQESFALFDSHRMFLAVNSEDDDLVMIFFRHPCLLLLLRGPLSAFRGFLKSSFGKCGD